MKGLSLGAGELGLGSLLNSVLKSFANELIHPLLYYMGARESSRAISFTFGIKLKISRKYFHKICSLE